MPEATQDIHDSPSLGDRVDALVGELNGAPAAAAPPAPVPAGSSDPAPPVGAGDPLAEAAAVLSQLSEPSPGAPIEAGGTPEVGQVAPDLAASTLAIASAEAVARSSASATSPLTAAPDGSQAEAADPGPHVPLSEASDEDLAKAVEKLIQAAPAEPAKAPESAAPPEKIESLDAELAGIADDLIAGEFANEAEVLKEEPVPAAPATPAAAVVAPPEPPKPEPAPAANAEPPAPVAVPIPAMKVATPTPAERPSLLLRAMLALSSPLRGRPKHVRDSFAWIALVQIFLAFCVWTYILFIRSNEPPLPQEPAPVKETAEAPKSEGEHAEKSEKPAKKEKRVSKPTHPPKKGKEARAE